jgi:hypothetical protein
MTDDLIPALTVGVVTAALVCVCFLSFGKDRKRAEEKLINIPRSQPERTNPLFTAVFFVVGGLGLYVWYEHEKAKPNRIEQAAHAFDAYNQSQREQERERKENPGLNLKAFDKLRTGMQHYEVLAIMGSWGTLKSSITVQGIPATEKYEWSSGSKSVTIVFQDNKLVAKEQTGLKW